MRTRRGRKVRLRFLKGETVAGVLDSCQFLAFSYAHSRLRGCSELNNGPGYLSAHRPFSKRCNRGIDFYRPRVRPLDDFAEIHEDLPGWLRDPGLALVVPLEENEDPGHREEQNEKEGPAGNPNASLHLTPSIKIRKDFLHLCPLIKGGKPPKVNEYQYATREREARFDHIVMNGYLGYFPRRGSISPAQIPR